MAAGASTACFGGVRWSPAPLPNWSLVAEYDAYNYKRDHGSEFSGAAAYKKELAVGVEYRREWFGVKAFSSHGYLGFNTYVNVPLESREFVPKLDEPAPYTKINPRPTGGAVARRRRASRAPGAGAGGAGFSRYQDRLPQREARGAADQHAHLVDAARGGTRGAHAALLRAARSPGDPDHLRAGHAAGRHLQLHQTCRSCSATSTAWRRASSSRPMSPIEYAKPEDRGEAADRTETLAAFEEPLPEGIVVSRDGADIVALRGANVLGGRVRVRPGLSTYLNDPSGAFKFELDAVGSYDRPLGTRRSCRRRASWSSTRT